MRAVRVIDQEIAQYLPRLNDQQKEAVLSVVKTFAAEQKDWRDEISKEPQEAIDRSLAEMCRPSLKRKNLRIGIINKHPQVVYHYQPTKKEIVTLLFWNFKQNPAKFKY